MMLYFYPVLFGALAVFYLVSAALSFIPDFQTWLLERLSKRVGLGVPVDLDARVRSRAGRRTRGGSVGGLIGMAVGLAALAAANRLGIITMPLGRANYIHLTVVLNAVLSFTVMGSVIGVARAALRSEAPRANESRVARAIAVTVSDYVPPLLRVGGWPILALGATPTIVLLATTGVTAWVIPGVALVSVGIVCQIAFEVVARRIVARGRPTSGTDELVWDDALRSESLRDFLHNPLYIVMLGNWYTLLGPGDALVSPLAVIFVILGVVGMVLFAGIFRNTRTRYLEELWPGARRRTADEEELRVKVAEAS